MNNTKVPKLIKVLIGQIAITRAPNVLQSVLGSCIGLSIYDQSNGIAGLAHILLPNSHNRQAGHLPGKFADLAVPCLVENIIKYGGVKKNLKAKVAGGARMFSKSMTYNHSDVGSMNVEAVIKALQTAQIPIVSKDVGGGYGRKVEFHVENFHYLIESLSEIQMSI